jgi:hypothetical protein
VLWEPGAGEIIDKWIRDFEVLEVLSNDGSLSSFRVLETALAGLVNGGDTTEVGVT